MKSTRQYMQSEERRNTTVRAVVALAAKQSPAEITTALIAEEMGITQGALFKHFSAKESIWQAVVNWVSVRILTRIAHAMRLHDSALEILEALFMGHIEFIAEHPGVPRLIFGELQRAGETSAKRIVRRLMRNYQKRLVEVMNTGKANGELASNLDVNAAAILFIGTIQGLVMQTLLANDIQQITRLAKPVFSVYRNGIRKCESQGNIEESSLKE